MKKEDVEKIMDNATEEQKKILRQVTDMLIEEFADTNPKAMLLKVYDDLYSSECNIVEKAIDSKETEKVERTIGILKQVTAIIKDFEKEVF